MNVINEPQAGFCYPILTTKLQMGHKMGGGGGEEEGGRGWEE